MAINITDEEWEELSPENFETAAFLRAVDAVSGWSHGISSAQYTFGINR